MSVMFDLFRGIGWGYFADTKAMASLLVGIAGMVTFFFLAYDLFIGKRFPKMWRGTLVAMMLVKGSIGVFGLIRFFDALYDATYLAEHPDVTATASQNVPILEIPMLGVGISIIIFLLVYSRMYYRFPKPRDFEHKRFTD